MKKTKKITIFIILLIIIILIFIIFLIRYFTPKKYQRYKNNWSFKIYKEKKFKYDNKNQY